MRTAVSKFFFQLIVILFSAICVYLIAALLADKYYDELRYRWYVLNGKPGSYGIHYGQSRAAYKMTDDQAREVANAL